MGYLYRRTDNEEIIEVDFETMMKQVNGCIVLENGVVARRCVYLEEIRDGVKKEKAKLGTDKPIVSDALGFAEHQLGEFEADRVKHGFTDVEFVRDPEVPQFFRAKIGSQAEFQRYMRHRGCIDRNSRNGGGRPIDANSLREAEKKVLEKYGPPKNLSKK